MSAEAVAWVWSLRGISASERVVLLRVAEHADFRGDGSPEGYEAIAEFCEVSPRQVMRIVKACEGRNLLSIERRRGKDARQLPNVIRLHVLKSVGGTAGVPGRVTSASPGNVQQPGDMPGDKPGDVGVTRLAMAVGGKGGDSRDTGRNNDVVTSSGSLNQQPLALEQGDISDQGDWFDREFWPRYPRKVAKGRAKRHLARLRCTSATHASILGALERAIRDWQKRNVEEKYIPYPQTWLSDEPWLEAAPTPRSTHSRTCACGCGRGAVVLNQGKWWARGHDPEQCSP